MAEYRESSMLFSLKGLMDVEDRRVTAERAEQQRKLDAARAARLESERVAREAQARLAEAARERAFHEELSRREHLARLQTRREAELERARHEAEARARLELSAQEQAHAERLRQMAEQTRARRGRTWSVGASSLAALTLVASLGLYFGKFRPEAERMQKAYAELASAQEQRADAAQRLLDRAARRESELEHALEGARAARDSGPGKLHAIPTPVHAAIHGARPAPARAAPSPRCVDNHDPLNGCL
jgi:colicin import membrane protein